MAVSKVEKMEAQAKELSKEIKGINPRFTKKIEAKKAELKQLKADIKAAKTKSASTTNTKTAKTSATKTAKKAETKKVSANNKPKTKIIAEKTKSSTKSEKTEKETTKKKATVKVTKKPVDDKTKKKETCEIIFQDDSDINISFLRFNKIKKKPWHPFFVYKDSYIPVYMVYTYFIKERRSIRKFKAELLPSKPAPRKEGRVVWAE